MLKKKFDQNWSLFIPWLPLLLLLFFSEESSIPAQPTVPQPEIIKKQSAKQSEIKLIFAGDIMGHGPQIRSAQIVENIHYDYTDCFQYIKPLITQVDLAIANLEVTLPGEPPYSGYPLFRSPDALAVALRQAGFHILLTANNHTNDGGKYGVLQTINTLYKHGLYQTGSFQSAAEREAYYPLIIYRKGFKLAFLNYTYSTNGIATKPPTIVNIIDETQMKKDFETARAMQPDFIISVMHWGAEYQQQPNQQQEQLAKKMINWGADLIIGAHPHVVQPIKLYTNNQNDTIPVAYSLGNFISNQRRAQTDGGLLFETELLKDHQTGITKLVNFDYHIIWRYIHTNKDGSKTFMVLPTDDKSKGLKLETLAKKQMQNYSLTTKKIISIDARD